MEYRIVEYPGGYHVTRYDPKTKRSENIGDFDSLETAEEFLRYKEDAERGL